VPAVITRSIGGRRVSALGLGGAHWSLPDAMDPRAILASVHGALDAGVTLIDTAHAYATVGGTCHNETMIAWALDQHPLGREVLVATKGGHYRDGSVEFPIDGRPQMLRRHCDLSLRALRAERIGLYQLHYPDPDVPLAESVGALADLRSEGKVELVGLSNVSVPQLDEAASITPIASVQNHFSLQDQDDDAMVEACAARGIAYLAYSPLGGRRGARSLAERIPALVRIAAAHGVSVPQVAIAWLLARSPTLIPIVGARRSASITDSAAGTHLTLDDEERRTLPSRSAGSTLSNASSRYAMPGKRSRLPGTIREAASLLSTMQDHD